MKRWRILVVAVMLLSFSSVTAGDGDDALRNSHVVRAPWRSE